MPNDLAFALHFTMVSVNQHIDSSESEVRLIEERQSSH